MKKILFFVLLLIMCIVFSIPFAVAFAIMYPIQVISKKESKLYNLVETILAVTFRPIIYIEDKTRKEWEK